LDRNELGALLVQAGLGSPRDHALIALLALNGLRISEALGADIADLDIERGHLTLRIVRKGGKHVTIPLAPRTARVLNLYVGERTVGPVFVSATGGRMDRSAADRVIKRLARRAGITKRISPHSLRSSPPLSMPGCRCATFKRRRRMLTHARRCATTVAASPSIGMPPTSSPPSSPAPPDKADESVNRHLVPLARASN
jgi:integrase